MAAECAVGLGCAAVGFSSRTVLKRGEVLRELVDELLACADAVGRAPGDELSSRLAALRRGGVADLATHLESVERVVYPALEQILPGRYQFAPMVREHGEVRRLIEELDRLRAQVGAPATSPAIAIPLRRLLLRLHGIAYAELEEEALFERIIEGTATPEEVRGLAQALEQAPHRDLAWRPT